MAATIGTRYISAKKRQSQLIVPQLLMVSQYLSSDRVWRISISQNCFVEKYRQSLLSYVFICRLLPSFKITRSQLPSSLVAQLVEQRWSVPKAQRCQNFHSFTVWAYFLSRTIAQKEYPIWDTYTALQLTIFKATIHDCWRPAAKPYWLPFTYQICGWFCENNYQKYHESNDRLFWYSNSPCWKKNKRS